MNAEIRTDALTGATVAVAPSRQDRPNRPDDTCPFCVGGREAPEPYRVRAFPNRWPSLPDERCEVVLYSPDHDATFWSMPLEQATAVVDLWADRTVALGRRPDIAYVLVGENRGPLVGATIAHPHGQIFGYADIPAVPAAELGRATADGCALCAEEPRDRLVASVGEWRAWVPHAAVHPYGLVLAPVEHVPDLPTLSAASRRDFAALLADVLGRLDHLWSEAPDRLMPSMLWIHQRPTDGGVWPDAHLHCEIAVPMRAPGVQRYVAAMELGSGEYVNPVVPEDAAAELRAVPVTW
jgi:UDPglucose--hexose-1-phosphate uridylyltransferase